MRVLLVGSGGREDVLLSKVKASGRASEIYVCPGNGGTKLRGGIRVDIEVNDVEYIVDYARAKKIDYAIIGPEEPLTKGLSDKLRELGIKCLGVSKAASLLESSKSFSKSILSRYNISTARYVESETYEGAEKHISGDKFSYPLVIKYDGLAAGKGVYICKDYEEGLKALEDIFILNKFGSGFKKVVIEEYLEGEELSAFAFSDGKSVVPLIYAKDYKKIFEGDEGPNTGGMGSYTPVSFMTKEIEDKIYEEVLKPTIEGLKDFGIEYKGVLYAGLMLSNIGSGDLAIKVLEYNVRFGDPEAQVILPLLKTDILDIIDALEGGYLAKVSLEWDSRASVCVVLASEGYPGSYKTGYKVRGLDSVCEHESLEIFHAGTVKKDDEIYTKGGRVLNVVGFGKDLEEANAQAYAGVSKISYSNKYYRKDIGGNYKGN